MAKFRTGRPARQRRRLVALLIAATLVAASCSNSGDDEAGTDGDSSEQGGGGGEGQGGDLPADLGDGPHGEFQSVEGVPGVTDDEIRFAVLSTGESNPLGYCLLECQAQAVEAYFDWRNSQGGVNGRDLTFDIVDDELMNNQVKALEIIESGNYFGVIGAPLQASGFQDLADAGYPVYTTLAQAIEAAGNESIYQTSGALCLSCPNRQYVYGPELAGATTVATIGFGISQASKECVEAQASSIEKWGPEVGLELGFQNDEMPFGLPNGIGPEVTAMKEAGVDFVLTCFDQVSVLTLEQELERQGMGEVTVMLPNAYSDQAYLTANADLLEGDLIGVAYRPFEADPAGSGLEDFQEWMAEAGHEPTDFGMLTWINADLAFRGILAAGPDFDQAKVVEATNTFTDYAADGLIAPTDWSRQHEPPTVDDPLTNGSAQQCYAYVKVVDGAAELIGDASKPHFCWDPSVDAWEEPTPTSFVD
jgi:hypothetical protein